MPTSTDVMQMAEYIVAKTGLDEHTIFGRGVLNHTRELVRRTFQSSFPVFETTKTRRGYCCRQKR